MPDVMTFHEAIEATEGEDRALLIGNGFSAQFFSYSTLLEQAQLEEGDPIRRLFEALDTFDFETVVQALEDAAIVERAYGKDAHANKLESDAQAVRAALVRAISEAHPEYRDDLVFQYESAAKFLSYFSRVFSLNYDLLLYWVNLEIGRLKDGFGRGEPSDDGRFRGPFREDAYCHIFNVHGGLHLFQDEVGDVHKALNTGDGLVANIAREIVENRRLPLYVAEGSSPSKLRRINSVAYLRHCYRTLQKSSATMFIFGHSAAPNDAHIYHAIFSSRAKRVYFGVFEPTEEKLRHFDAELAKYQKLGGDKVEYGFFVSETAHVWDGPAEVEESE